MITSWDYAYDVDPQNGAPVVIRTFKTKWWDKFDDRKYDHQFLNNWFNKNPKFCKMGKLSQETVRFLQAKSNASALLAQAKNKTEYKRIMVEMLNSLDSDEEQEQEEDSTTSKETTDLS
ncbi:Uncharacterized protein TCM_023381 [Theobroma cacao]|uniref:Uncharacterized protein n=1 Tax=Theobroma cacao TaxID=3641 RepID=A0A061EU44_THECC|nr:Uncharacterized protein TCM_023381 [Theobroma cacao]